MYYKVIIQGRLEFGNPKSYRKVIKMYDYRNENYYKNQLIFETENIFSDEDLSMEIPRHVSQVTEKSFKNTCSLLDYCSQFAVAGSIRAWQIDEGKIMHYAIIEPDSDKVAVRSFLKGRKLVKQIGKEDEAIEALSKAIEKYDRHAQAYERRAKVNFLLKKYHDAKRDYTKCINIDSTIPTAYYGRAKVFILEEKYAEAIEDLTKATKFSIALQTVYWKAKRIKAECHMKLKQWDKAAFDLKFFSKRRFSENDPNFPWKKWAYHFYGVCLLELKEYREAVDAFNEALEYEDGYGSIEDSESLRLRSFAKKNAGKTGYLKDLKASAKMGNKRAKTQLKEMA